MNTTDMMTDEEAMQSEPVREELLARSISTVPRKVGELSLRPMTSETFTYLWHVRNLFLNGVLPESEIVNKNPVWSTAEFVYIHAADLDAVAQDIWDENLHRDNVRAFLRGPLNTPQMLTAALPVIEEMVKEYFAVQNEGIADGQAESGPKHYSGKEPARAGKQAT